MTRRRTAEQILTERTVNAQDVLQTAILIGLHKDNLAARMGYARAEVDVVDRQTAEVRAWGTLGGIDRFRITVARVT